ncbi:MAG TPA: riboflavin synthase [Thermoanaerobaculia bacterium]|nr:riboflavin synthase [Thermoanaerobaculia bacterium]
MFSGIVAGVGRIVSRTKRGRGARIRLAPPRSQRAFSPGESVAIDGVCLTALRGGRLFEADLSAETLARTTLGGLRAGDPVNVERSLRWGDRISGHFVLGHVDAVAPIRSVEASRGGGGTYRFGIPAGLGRYVVEKGSVALDGISLTVSRRHARDFEVAVIPETLRRTALGRKRAGAKVNFEADVFARYGRARGVARVRRDARRR